VLRRKSREGGEGGWSGGGGPKGAGAMPLPELLLGRKRKEQGGEEEEKEERGRGCTAAPPDPMSPPGCTATPPARGGRRCLKPDVATPPGPTSPSGLQGGRLRKGRRAGAAQEGRPWKIQGQHAFAVHRPSRSRPWSSCLFIESDRLLPSSPSSPERPGAGLQHRGDVAVEAVHRAALLPLLQAVPLLVTAPPRRRVQNAR
jgi:hypothetical protein